jgi:hypothetical protein
MSKDFDRKQQKVPSGFNQANHKSFDEWECGCKTHTCNYCQPFTERKFNTNQKYSEQEHAKDKECGMYKYRRE